MEPVVFMVCVSLVLGTLPLHLTLIKADSHACALLSDLCQIGLALSLCNQQSLLISNWSLLLTIVFDGEEKQLAVPFLFSSQTKVLLL